jgi:hypothetical protein
MLISSVSPVLKSLNLENSTTAYYSCHPKRVAEKTGTIRQQMNVFIQPSVRGTTPNWEAEIERT